MHVGKEGMNFNFIDVSRADDHGGAEPRAGGGRGRRHLPRARHCHAQGLVPGLHVGPVGACLKAFWANMGAKCRPWLNPQVESKLVYQPRARPGSKTRIANAMLA
jgi:hypothetical protein